MNAKAKDLGMKSTRFEDPVGLNANNRSTPRDLVLMLRAAIKQPLISEITQKAKYVAHPVGKPGWAIEYNNTDLIARGGKFSVLTGKTGYTDLALYCLAIAVRMAAAQPHDVAMVFLGAVGKMTRFADFQRTAQWLTERKWKAGPPRPLPTRPCNAHLTAAGGGAPRRCDSARRRSAAVTITSPATAAQVDLAVPDMTAHDMTPPTSCSPTDPMTDGTSARRGRLSDGTIGVNLGGACGCYQTCTTNLECSCDRVCDPVTTRRRRRRRRRLPAGQRARHALRPRRGGAPFGNGFCGSSAPASTRDVALMSATAATPAATQADCPAQTTLRCR